MTRLDQLSVSLLEAIRTACRGVTFLLFVPMPSRVPKLGCEIAQKHCAFGMHYTTALVALRNSSELNSFGIDVLWPST
jgi:hypothetical protein